MSAPTPTNVSVRIPFVAMFARYFRFFAGLVRGRMAVYVALTLVNTASEGVGIALLLPLLSGGDVTHLGGPIGSFVQALLTLFHLPATLTGVLAALVIVTLAKAGLTFATTAYQHYLSAKITQDLRRELIAGLAEVDYRYILSTTSARIVTVVSSETLNAATGFLFFARLFPHAITVLAFLAIVARVDWRLMVVVIAAGVLLSPLLRLPPRIAKRLGERANEEGIGLMSLLFQAMHSYKYLKGTAGMPRLEPKLEQRVREVTVLNYKIGAASSFAFALPQPIVTILLAGVMLWLVRTGGAGALSTGFVVLIFLYRSMNELFAMQAEWQQFSAHIPSVDQVRRTLAELSERRERIPPDAPAPEFRNAIELVDVRFGYDDTRTVLDGLRLRIPKNSTVAIVGESGAGKSTLIDLLSGVLRPSSGQVLVDGRPLGDLDLRAWRRTIGYVPQEPLLFEDSVANNVSLWVCDLADPVCAARIEDAARRASCDEFVREMPGGYGAHIGERGSTVSGGQRQRLAIARELFKQPQLLILDEATSALDTGSETAIRNSLDALKGSLTVVVIAHRLSTIRNCDHVFVLQKGRLLEEGGFDELLARSGSRLAELAKQQSL